MAELSNQTAEEDYRDDCDFSGHEILRYIDQILMEEDFDDETLLLQQSSDFRAKEKSFYELLDQKYPPSPPHRESGDNNSTTNEGETYNNNNNNNNNEVAIKKKIGAKGRQKRTKKPKKKKKQVIDFATLLVECAQSIAADDRVSANELLRQIREHSSPFGDGNQRLAHYFADGFEARMAGTGTQIRKSLVCRRTTSPRDFMKAFSTYMVSNPVGRTTFFAMNKSMAIKSEKATRVHVIDFGILCGFQWPTFIQRLAERAGGPPMLRITGIDFPLPGFRPAERIETAGRWLASHAKALNVPFEFHAVAQKWETIEVEDLKIEKGEFIAVSCSCRSKNLPDEAEDGLESPRNRVLDLIRRINPDVFMHGVVNAAYGDPYFVPRFRKALFHFWDLFDMLETTMPREMPERMVIEKDIFAKEVFNVIACEGSERVERPETYRQWGSRHLRAGFRAVPFERQVMDTIMVKVREFNVREFVVIEENNWLLMSWNGRIIYAISNWQPACDFRK